MTRNLLSIIALLIATGAYAADSGQVVVSWGPSPTSTIASYIVDDGGGRLTTDQGDPLVTALQGDDRPITPDAVRQIVLTHTVDANRALSLSVTAYDKEASGVTRIVIATDSRTLVTCSTQPCSVTWKRSEMPLTTNNLMVTITNAANKKYGMPAQIARP